MTSRPMLLLFSLAFLLLSAPARADVSEFSSYDECMRRYLSLGLLPQAGVSIGLVLAAREYVSDPSAFQIMVNTILACVIINELISPLLVKTALIKSGEAQNPGGE